MSNRTQTRRARRANVQITPKPGEPIEKLLKRFKRVMVKTLVDKDASRHRHYMKPSERRHDKHLEAMRKWRKRAANQPD
jgi:ribosomal protein S21